MTTAVRVGPSTGRVRLGALLVFVTSCAILLTVFGYEFFPLQADETSLAWQAKLAHEGYVPYRDYFAYKPPLAIYLPAGLFSVIGPSLAALRLFSVASLAGTTVLLYLLCVRTRIGVGWAMCVALMLPALMVPNWPVASGQWMSLAFGFAALLCVTGAPRSWRPPFVAGLLVALAGLCVQTHGALFAGLLAIRLVMDPATRSRRVLVATTVGVGVPLLAVLLALWYGDLLGDAFRDVVIWPLRYYKQPGGFNDAARQDSRAATAWTASSILEILRLLFVIAIPLVATIASVLFWLGGSRGPRAIFALLGSVLLWFVFLRGRTDPVHLVLLAPVFLYLVVQHVDWTAEGIGVRLMRVWLVLAVVFMVRWPAHWIDEPPSIEAVRVVDVRWRGEGPPTLVTELPAVAADDLPILFLGAHGASLYFLWAPIPPPVDWLQPPSDRLNSPEEFEAIANFAEHYQVPYIVMQGRSAEAWVRDPSPVADELREHYQRAFDTSWGTAYCRIGAKVPRTGEVICDHTPATPTPVHPPA